ncbi:MAG: isoprenylcysteine carboxylmethyltransferase family protein [Pseudomonadota bacterium]
MMIVLRIIDSPPVWTLLFGFAAWKLTTFGQPLGDALSLPGYTIMGVGVLLTIWAVTTLIAAKTTPVPRSKPRTLVRKGPYRFSRNPIYLADLVILFGWCLSLGQPASLLLVPVLAFLLGKRFIAQEEETLRKRFGSVYRTWRTETPRWL